jgi:hypothetical protein
MWSQFKCLWFLMEDMILNLKYLRIESNIGHVGMIDPFFITLQISRTLLLPCFSCSLYVSSGPHAFSAAFPYIAVVISILFRIL